MNDARLADHVLELIRGMGYCVGVVGITKPDGTKIWHIDARGKDEHEYRAKHEDYYRAAVLLAELVGAELRE